MSLTGYQVCCGGWDAVGDAAGQVRFAVFIDEQGIPESEEWDEDDSRALHAVVLHPSGLPVATGRLIPPLGSDAPAKVGRMAVVRAERSKGLGELVLKTLLEEAAIAGYGQVALHAQVSAEGFYKKAGFAAEGPVFDEVGIPHQLMLLNSPS